VTKKELEYVAKVLSRIVHPDEHVAKAVAYVQKDLAHYAACKGQLLEQYDYEATRAW